MTHATPRPHRLRHGSDALVQIARTAVAMAEDEGATAVVHASETAGTRATARDGSVDLTAGDQMQWLTIQVRDGNRQGTAGTARFDRASIAAAVAQAHALAGFAGEDPDGAPPSPDRLAWRPRAVPLLSTTDWTTVDLGAQALAIEAAAVAEGGDVAHVVDQAGVATHDHATAIAMSGGFGAGYDASSHSRWCSVAAGPEGDRRLGDHSTSRREAGRLQTLDRVGREAARRAIARLSPRSMPAGALPVLFEPRVARDVIGSLASALSGQAQTQRSGFLTDAAGTLVLPAHLDLRQDPFLPFGPASRPFDGEGVAGTEREIVCRGVVTGYLLGTRWARRLGRVSTGDAGGASNLRLISRETDPDDDFAAMLRKLGDGLVVTTLSNQGVNPFTGDWSRAATGFRVAGGEIVHAVEGVTLTGNLRSMLSRIVAVGADVDDESAIATGSILIDRLELNC